MTNSIAAIKTLEHDIRRNADSAGRAEAQGFHVLAAAIREDGQRMRGQLARIRALMPALPESP